MSQAHARTGRPHVSIRPTPTGGTIRIDMNPSGWRLDARAMIRLDRLRGRPPSASWADGQVVRVGYVLLEDVPADRVERVAREALAIAMSCAPEGADP